GRPRRRRANARGGGGAASPRGSLCREALAAARATPLENRAAGARRHPGAEPVLALPAAYVGLISPLHEYSRKKKVRRANPPSGQYRRATRGGLSTEKCNRR